jgi:hypothetical protein
MPAPSASTFRRPDPASPWLDHQVNLVREGR